MSDFTEKISKLDEIDLKVLAIMHIGGGSWFGYGNCYYPHNSILGGDGNIPDITDEVGGKKGLSRSLKKLRDLGLANYMRGLMTDDGEVAGSGNAPNALYQKDIEALCEQRGWL